MANAQLTRSPETEAAWRNVVTRAWSDEQFKNKLVDDPNSTLAEAGIPLPSGVNAVIVENEPGRIHLVLPAKPGDVSVNEMQLTDGDYDPGF